ncbi:hypothetical protein KI387_011332, partial [Taxus chinensis]
MPPWLLGPVPQLLIVVAPILLVHLVPVPAPVPAVVPAPVVVPVAIPVPADVPKPVLGLTAPVAPQYVLVQ